MAYHLLIGIAREALILTLSATNNAQVGSHTFPPQSTNLVRLLDAVSFLCVLGSSVALAGARHTWADTTKDT